MSTIPNASSDAGLAHRPGGPGPGTPPADNSKAVVQLAVAGVFSVLGCFLAIPAAILGILAVTSHRESPARSARFTRWGWIAFAAGVGLTVLAGVGLVVIASLAASGNN
jgi:hypothetical protein